MFHRSRPTNHNTQQIDSRSNQYRQGAGSYMYRHRLHHGFTTQNEWNHSNHNGRPTSADDRRYDNEPFYKYQGKGPKNYKRNDYRIYEEVCELLTVDPHIDATDIEVTVKNGNVTLSGTVPSRGMKWEAEDVALSVSGIKDIQCDIKVQRSHHN